ncbi:hypothetical protein [Curtobacterium sp. RRHDQ10]|uniref:hypothetical protein n=1 Tax=Curtobacterium phyllosphaerae TaxID=3413379 RepID=UPI003BF1D784
MAGEAQLPQALSDDAVSGRPGASLRDGGRPIAGALTGAVGGLVLGVGVDAGVWLWAFGQALSGQAVLTVPLVVTTSVDHGDVVARSGIGVVVIPLASAVLGIVTGWFVGRAHRAGPDAELTADP